MDVSCAPATHPARAPPRRCQTCRSPCHGTACPVRPQPQWHASKRNTHALGLGLMGFDGGFVLWSEGNSNVHVDRQAGASWPWGSMNASGQAGRQAGGRCRWKQQGFTSSWLLHAQPAICW
eukprot:355744-Chlamydomonas_euryale.AAC.4